MAFPFLIIALGGIIWSTRRLKGENGGYLSYQAAFTHIILLILPVWLMDLTILDWILLVTITPKFVFLPGTEGLAGYDDYIFHLKEHLRAFPFLILVGAILAFFLASRKSLA